MTSPDTPPIPEVPKGTGPVRAPFIGTGTALVLSMLAILLMFGYCSSRVIPGFGGHDETKVSHDLVVSQLRAVAKLVSSEATVRDVVTYENTWYGSTKRSLVVVTGRLTAGIDLGDSSDVSIDSKAKKIRIVIPPAKLMGVEVLDMKTYDESGGLWNPFKPSDRDAIQRQVRAQLGAAGQQTELLRHANTSAAEMLRMLLSKDGYTVEVTTRGTPVGPFVN
ncbi:MAG: DUF4230 domain-containing protein [Gemmatimonadaceae bacterium]